MFKGNVKSVNRKSIPFANITMTKEGDTNNQVTFTTDSAGKFEFLFAYTEALSMTISAVGYNSTAVKKIPAINADHMIDMGNIILKDQSISLDSVTIRANPKLIQRKIDRYVINLEESMVATGYNLVEGMQYLPGLFVNERDQVQVNGKSGLIFFVNGKRIYAVGEQLTSILKGYQTDQIKSIEVITNPPASYDAEGSAGIINIILKKAHGIGSNGDVNLSHTRGRKYLYSNGSINYNYQGKKLGFYSSLNVNQTRSIGYYYVNRNYEVVPSPFSFNQADTTLDKKPTFNYNIQSDYNLTRNSIVSVGINGLFQKLNSDYNSSTLAYNGQQSLDSSFVTQNRSDLTSMNFASNVGYQLKLDTIGTQLNLGYVFSVFRDKKDVAYNTSFYDSDGLEKRGMDRNTSYNPTNLDIHSFKADYISTLWSKNKVEIGIKTSFIKTYNSIAFFNLNTMEFIADRSNQFTYNEHIFAGYLNWNRSFKSWEIQAGLRLENTSTRGEAVSIDAVSKKDYLNLFPSLFIKKSLNEDNDVVFSYSRRIQRPNYQSLNPLKFYYDPYFYEEGNPNLSPQITNSFELNYTFKDYILSAGIKDSKNFIQSEFSNQNDTTRVFTFNTVNIDSYKSYYAILILPFTVNTWLKSQFDFNYGYDTYKGQTNSGVVDSKLGAYSLRLNNNFILNKTASITLFTYYKSRRIDAQTHYNSYFITSIAIRKSLLKSRAALRLTLTDLFNTQNSKGTVDFANQYFRSRYYWDARRIGLSFTYKFSSAPQKRSKVSNSIIEEELDRKN
ncbi:outer membrane beta-barrel protein [Pedobacter sp. AW31-3R]|uniref:outer membrane beta-barrel protein n=1 Tax=Pedobacter sp. AW31-3R TaxID=3445781 RepID=UPI003FA07708